MNFERLGDESPTTNEKRLGDKSPTTNEKEENIGTRLKKTLESEQIDVVWQTDGKSALAQLEKHPFDLILLELLSSTPFAEKVNQSGCGWIHQ